MNLSNQITKELIDDVKLRIFEECFPRIHQCLDELSVEEIWHKPNENSNSIGNLVLHVCGNLRQYFLNGIANQEDIRNRTLEFEERGPLSVDVLKSKMHGLIKDIEPVLQGISPETLVLEKEVQGFRMSVISILVHVTEHLSYHTGQIAFYTKLIKNVDLKFYGDMDLNIHSNS